MPIPSISPTHYNATLTYSHDSNLLMVLRARADIALVTRSYLSDYLLRNEKVGEQLLVSQRIDQVYHHYAMIRPHGADHWRGIRQVAARVAGQWPDAEDFRSLQDCRGAGPGLPEIAPQVAY